jgi:hypothetical protein
MHMKMFIGKRKGKVRKNDHNKDVRCNGMNGIGLPSGNVQWQAHV